MFKTLLVPLDGTPQAGAALPAARTLARISAAEVVLVRAIESADTEAVDGVRAYLVRVADELARDGTSVRWHVCIGEAGEEIVRATKEYGADAVIMATHGRSGLARAFVGSVAERVVADGTAPVLLIKPGGKRLSAVRTVLVPVDGTAGGALALASAIGLARLAQARLVLVQAVPPLPLWMYAGDMGMAPAAYVDPAWEEEAFGAAQLYVNRLAARLKEADLEADGLAIKGEATVAIEQVAEQVDADLIVMSTHAHTGPARTLLGSVADGVVRTAGRPVLLVRRPRAALDVSPADPLAATVG